MASVSTDSPELKAAVPPIDKLALKTADPSDEIDPPEMRSPSALKVEPHWMLADTER
jgi:hypothetical protein